MATRVRVLNIPNQLNNKNLISLFGNILRIDMRNVNMKTVPSSGLRKEVILTFKFPSDAQLAQAALDDYVYTYNNQLFVFTARYDYNRDYDNRYVSPDYNRGRYNDRHHDRRGESRHEYVGSRHQEPNLDKKSSDLDRQIEILKKQRLILEEERKILEEQQRLQALKMKLQLSPKATAAPSVPDTAHSSRPDSNAQKPVSYYKACGVLIRLMDKIISQYSQPENRKALVACLRTALSDRIVALVDGQPIYQTQKIIEMYRNRYSESDDKILVKEIAESLDETLWDEDDSLSAEMDFEGESASKTYSGTKHSYIKNKDRESEKSSVAGDNPASSKPMRYFQASNVLLKKMFKTVDEYAEGEKRKALVTLLRYRVKDRFAAVIAGRPIYITYKVLQAYREVYPVETDEQFIKDLLKEIDEKKWDAEDIRKIYKKWHKTARNAAKAEAGVSSVKVSDPAKKDAIETSVEKKNEDRSATANKEVTINNSKVEDTSQLMDHDGENENVPQEVDSSENKVTSVNQVGDDRSATANKEVIINNSKVEDTSQLMDHDGENENVTQEEDSSENNVTSVDQDGDGEKENVTQEVDSSENKVTSIDQEQNKAVINEATKSDSSVEKKNEAANEELSTNNTHENLNTESTKPNCDVSHTDVTWDEEGKGVKRRTSTADDGEAKLAKIWEEGDELDVTDELAFEDWSCNENVAEK